MKQALTFFHLSDTQLNCLIVLSNCNNVMYNSIVIQHTLNINEQCMARKKAVVGKGDRSSPQSNKSLAVRLILKKMPGSKALKVAEAVKKEYGHEVSQNMIYMVKTKTNMAADRKESPITTAALWVDAIKTARQLLKATGSVANATALLKALDR